MKNNIEVILMLVITFLIFVTLVIFYESKIPKYYETEKKFSIKVTVTDINNNIITLNNKHYLETDLELDKNKTYEITLNPTDKLIEKGNITKLLQEYTIDKIKTSRN